MSNQVYIPPINFNEFDNQTGSITSINAVEPLEYNKLNSQLSIKAATENNYGVITTGTQTFKGLKTFSDNLTVYTGSVLTDPTNDTDISNKKYVDTKTTDLVKYNTSTKYLVDNKTNSNISNFRINNLTIDNQINGSSVSVSVSTKGYHGTDTKNITVYKGYVNGMTCIIFNKNTEINSYKWVSDIAMDNNGMIMDFSNFSDIYSSLPQMFELTGETSTYGGSKNIATKTLKFIKSSGYKYTVQYDKSFPMNLFKLKDSIKDTDTYIFTSETNKIGTLTIDKGYLYSSPTESNNLVNKSYVDNKTIAITEEFKKKDTEIISSLNSNVSLINDYIQSTKSELNGNIENAKIELNENITSAINGISEISLNSGTLANVQNNTNSLINKNYVDNQISKAKVELNNSIKTASNDTKAELNQNITNAINNIKIDNVNLTTGTISTDPANDTDITNKKYIDTATSVLMSEINNTKATLNNKITSSINGINDINLTTGTISTTPANDTDISNKKYVDAKADEINDSINSLKSYSDSNYIKYDSGSNKLFKSSSTTSQQINNLNVDNITSTVKVDTFQLSSNASVLANLTVNDTITFSNKILSVLTSDANIENYQGEILTTCKVNVLRIKLNANTYFIKLSFNFAPFTTVEKTRPIYYIRYIDIPLSGTSQSFDINYFYRQKKTDTEGGGYDGYLNVGRCLMEFYNGSVAFNVNKYVVQLGNTEASRSIPNNCEIFTIPDITFIYTDSI